MFGDSTTAFFAYFIVELLVDSLLSGYIIDDWTGICLVIGDSELLGAVEHLI